jgi:hypothetical protein
MGVMVASTEAVDDTWRRFRAGMRNRSYLALLMSVLAVASMLMYVEKILVPYQQADALAKQMPRGNLSDLYPRWLGAKELLLSGKDPYSNAVKTQIQAGYYGRPLDAHRPNDPKDQQAFAYPVYVVFLLAPTVKFPFEWVRSAAVWLFVALTAASVLLWLRALGWKIAWKFKLVWIVLTLGSFPAIQGLKLQQLTLLVAALLAGAMSAMAGEHLFLAGVLLALATIKPHLAVILAVVLSVWTLGNLRERQKFLWGFGFALFILIAGGEILLPGWISKFRVATEEYWRYTGGGQSVLSIEIGSTWGRVASGILIVLLLYFAWRLRRMAIPSVEFGWLLAVTIATTLMVIPMYAPYNRLLLLPALMMILRALPKLREAGIVARVLVMLTGLSVLWPWIAAVALLLGLLILPASAVENLWAVPLWTNFAIPTVILGLLLVCRKSIMEA